MVNLFLLEAAPTATNGSNAINLTEIFGWIIAIITGIFVPIYMYKRNQKKINEQDLKFKAILDKQEAEKEGANSVTSWDNLAKRLERERDRLAEQLEEADNRFSRRLAVAEERWRKEREVDRARISDLEKEVEALQLINAAQARRLSGMS